MNRPDWRCESPGHLSNDDDDDDDDDVMQDIGKDSLHSPDMSMPDSHSNFLFGELCFALMILEESMLSPGVREHALQSNRAVPWGRQSSSGIPGPKKRQTICKNPPLDAPRAYLI